MTGTGAGDLRQPFDGKTLADVSEDIGLHPGNRRGFIGRHGQEWTELRLAALPLRHHDQPLGDGARDLRTVVLPDQRQREIDPAVAPAEVIRRLSRR